MNNNKILFCFISSKLNSVCRKFKIFTLSSMATSTKKDKKPKDPNAPKRPLTSYFVFAKANRSRIKEENPELRASEITKKISAEWKELDSNGKIKYQQEAEKLKGEYNQRVIEYQKTSNYKKYQKKLQKWNDDQAEKKRLAELNYNTESEVKYKIISFFDDYYKKMAAKRYPSDSVCYQYDKALGNAREWLEKFKEKDFELALYACLCLIRFKPNINKMDFSYGGPSFFDLLDIASALSKEAKTKSIPKKEIRKMYKSLEKYHKMWDAYSMGDGVKEVLDEMKELWSF